MPTTVRPFLMFQKGDAEEAMNFYVATIPGARIVDLKRWGKEGPGKEGTVQAASLAIGDQAIRFFDSPVKHAFEFTPAISLFIDYTDEAEMRRIAGALAEGGQALMPLDNYGFSRLFAWINDRFGVSWQVNLP